jgi:phosphate transport system substrate-binding protein
MKKKLGGQFVATLGALVLATTLLASSAGASATLTGDLTYSGTTLASAAPSFGGSTFDEPFLDAAIPVYLTQASNKSGASAVPTGLPLYDGVGSSAGKKGVVAGTFQVGFTDVPFGALTGTGKNINLDASTLTGASNATTLNSYVQVPIVLGGVAVTYNLPTVTAKFPKTPVILDASTLAKIYTGAITKWNDPAIVALNKDLTTYKTKLVKVKKNGKFEKKNGKFVTKKVKTATGNALPSTTITPVYRADGSGTSFAFQSFLNQAASATFTSNSAITATTSWPGTSWPSGLLPSGALGAQKSAGVAYDVQQTEGSIGYVEASYLSQDGLAAANIVNSSGKAEPLNATTVAADASSFSSKPPAEGSNGQVSNYDIADGSAANAYPISTYSWAVVPQDFSTIGISADASGSTGGVNAETVVAKFLDWAVQGSGGQAIATKEGYVPLPSYVSALAEAQIGLLTFNKTSLGLS